MWSLRRPQRDKAKWRLRLKSGKVVELYSIDPHPDGGVWERQWLRKQQQERFRKVELAWMLDREYGQLPTDREQGMGYGQWPS